ncbi:MAG: hypothetical protein F2734_04685 [Actinobacteria bacterium]|uniref:Unannotated protein n=3 Tax=freshwater metagenome TaxID=449393 RepID=A0A6J6XK31_9ZZZZ|nr:hypothetical protein [Actinomycetota bacterium]MTA46378.1 hypothetical protein [Actinomycetota bacterium]
MSKLKRRAISMLALLLIAAAAFLFGWSDVFTVNSISITGVNASEEKLVASRIQNRPEVAKIGIPLARVDKRVVSTRISELQWIRSVKVNRNWITKEIQIGVTRRVPIAVIMNSGGRTFLDSELQIFSVPMGGELTSEMSNLPMLTLKNSTPESLSAFDQLRSKIAEIKPSEINAKKLEVRSYLVGDPANSATLLAIDERTIKVTWGNSEDLALKIKVFRELLLLPENVKIVRMDLTAPLSPIVK